MCQSPWHRDLETSALVVAGARRGARGVGRAAWGARRGARGVGRAACDARGARS
jgi:hypothetical protein